MSRMHESWEAVASTLGYKNEADMLVDMYLVQKMSIMQIVDKLGYAKNAVRERLMLLGIKRRPRGGPNMLGKTRLGHIPDEDLLKLKHGAVIKDSKGFKFHVHQSTLYHELRRRGLKECSSPQSAPSPILKGTPEDPTSKCASDAGRSNIPSTLSGIVEDEKQGTSSSSTTELMKESSSPTKNTSD